MLKTLVQKTYAVDVTVNRLFEILREDAESGPSLDMKLRELDGIIKVEYDGHFGPHIFITIEVGEDTDETWRLAEEIIKG